MSPCRGRLFTRPKPFYISFTSFIILSASASRFRILRRCQMRLMRFTIFLCSGYPNDFSLKQSNHVGEFWTTILKISDICQTKKLYLGRLYFEDKTFQIPIKYKNKKYVNAIIAHELLHFMFYDYLEKSITPINYPEETVWQLSELFNTLILVPCSISRTCYSLNSWRSLNVFLFLIIWLQSCWTCSRFIVKLSSSKWTSFIPKFSTRYFISAITLLIDLNRILRS